MFWKNCIVYSTVRVVLALQGFLWYKCCSCLKCWATVCLITKPLLIWQSPCQVYKTSGTRGKQVKFLPVHLCLPSSNIHLFIYSYSHLGWLGIIAWGRITKGHCIPEIRIKSKEVYLFSEVISMNWVMSLSYSPWICELETYFKKWEYCRPEASRSCSFSETLTLQELCHTLPKGSLVASHLTLSLCVTMLMGFSWPIFSSDWVEWDFCLINHVFLSVSNLKWWTASKGEFFWYTGLLSSSERAFSFPLYLQTGRWRWKV